MSNIYICSPHRLTETNEKIANALADLGNTVYLPQDFCKEEDENGDHRTIRKKCIESIENAHIFLMYLDEYGMDSSWELGYAEKAGKKIIGLSLDSQKLNTPKIPNPRKAWDNWMHGWHDREVINLLTDLTDKISDKKVYFSVPIRLKENITLLENQLRPYCKKIYFPWDIEDINILSTPRQNWINYRLKCINAIEDSEVFLMNLNDYGMDSSWELGYAEKAGKQIIGLNLNNEKICTQNILKPKLVWDNWMHGWREKSIIHGIDMLGNLLDQRNVFKIPVVCPIIERRNDQNSIEVLIQTRTNPKDQKYYGVIEIPGGKIRSSETITDALKREVKEECGLDVEPIVQQSNYQYKIQGSAANIFEVFTIADEVGDHSYIGLFIRCHVTGGTLRPTIEGIDQKWASINLLEKLLHEKRVLPINAPGLLKYIEEANQSEKFGIRIDQITLENS